MSMLNNKENRVGIKILIAVIFQLLILTSIGVKRAYTVSSGKTVVLSATTYDPCDMFRGDYVSLRYDIANVPKEIAHECGREVYTLLQEGQPYWLVKSVSYLKPKIEGGEVVMKGKLDFSGIKYGIERFYVPEGQGKILEKSGKLVVNIAVDADGCAIVKTVEPEH